MQYLYSKVIVSDLKKSVTFYEDVLHQSVRSFNGDHVIFASGLVLYSESVWKETLILNESVINFGGNDISLCFEEMNFDLWVLDLESRNDIEFINHVEKQPNGQRIVRFYDLDRHVVEVGEALHDLGDNPIESQMAFIDSRISLGMNALGTMTISPNIDSISRNKIDN